MSTSRKPYPHVIVGGAAARELLSLAARWGISVEEVILRLTEQAVVGRTTVAAVRFAGAIIDEITKPLPEAAQAKPISSSVDPFLLAAKRIP